MIQQHTAIKSNSNTLSQQRLQELIAAARARAAAIQNQSQSPVPSNEVRPASIVSIVSIVPNDASNSTNQPASTASPDSTPNANTLTSSAEFTWNQEQQAALELFKGWQSFAVVGSAGTGKSTLCKAGIRIKCQDAAMPIISSHEETESLPAGISGIVAVSFTRSAVANINRIIEGAIPVLTIHKLLEFKPQFYEEQMPDGTMKTKRIFEPARNAANTLPHSLRTIIIEESGIVNIRLFNQLLDALPNPELTQFIFLGDLFQLNPPYDPAVLGYALNAIPVVELTQVYRQALHSPILRFAVDIKEKKQWGSQHFPSLCCETPDGNLTVKPWKHRIDSFKATIEAAKFIEKEYVAGRWSPERSCIITPFGAALNSKDKEAAFGSYNLNRLIADFVGRRREAIIHEVIAGFVKHYLAVGDDIVYQKIRGKIVKIVRNGSYMGKQSPQAASQHLDRFGHRVNGTVASELDELMQSEEDVECEMDRLMAAASSDNESAFRNASHRITLKLENDAEIELSSSGDFNPQIFDFAYSMTCYKAQGSEWDSVYVFTHKSHATMLSNEFFYTACTRARKQLTLICEPDHLLNAVTKQETAGSNWKEKSSCFNTPKALESIKPFTQLNEWLQSHRTFD